MGSSRWTGSRADTPKESRQIVGCGCWASRWGKARSILREEVYLLAGDTGLSRQHWSRGKPKSHRQTRTRRQTDKTHAQGWKAVGFNGAEMRRGGQRQTELKPESQSSKDCWKSRLVTSGCWHRLWWNPLLLAHCLSWHYSVFPT